MSAISDTESVPLSELLRYNGTKGSGATSIRSAMVGTLEKTGNSAELGVRAWSLQMERGPNWLVITVAQPPGRPWEMVPLNKSIQTLLNRHLTYHLVLELHEIELVNSLLIGQLVALRKWIDAKTGVLRLCGLSSHALEVLHRLRLGGFFSVFPDRLQAISGRSNSLHPG